MSAPVKDVDHADLIEELALKLYIDWSPTSAEQSRRRWALMPTFGRRAFLSLARVAVEHIRAQSSARRSGTCSQCPGPASTPSGMCMACASREAE